jgi:hypothetical protein
LSAMARPSFLGVHLGKPNPGPHGNPALFPFRVGEVTPALRRMRGHEGSTGSDQPAPPDRRNLVLWVPQHNVSTPGKP